MNSEQTFQRLNVLRCGPIARALLAEDSDIHVAAIFERTIYIASGSGLVCVGPPDLVAGPINVSIDDDLVWSNVQVAIEDEGRVERGTIIVADAFSLDATVGVTWAPPPLPTYDSVTLRSGVAHLRELLAHARFEDGLATLILAPNTTISSLGDARAAAAPIAHLRDALPAVLRKGEWTADCLRAALLLIGLGPGFTPFGDNIIGGLMLALTAANKHRMRDQLWHALHHELDLLTTAPSAMHLSAAADGMAIEPALALIGAVMEHDPQRIKTSIAHCLRLRTSSGRDIVAGILFGFEIVLEADSQAA